MKSLKKNVKSNLITTPSQIRSPPPPTPPLGKNTQLKSNIHTKLNNKDVDLLVCMQSTAA